MGRKETAEEFHNRRRKKRSEDNRRVMRVTVLILQVGISMMTCIFLCGIPGYFLAGHTGHPVIFPLFLVLGILSGFRSCHQVIERFYGRLEGSRKRADDGPASLEEGGSAAETDKPLKADAQEGTPVPEGGGEDEDELDEDEWI